MSALEDALALQMKAAGLPVPHREFYFCRGLGHRFDFAFVLPEAEVALGVEVEGGTWVGGRHTRGAGYEGDCRKYAIAACLGWMVIRVTAAMVESGEALALIEAALGRRSVDELIQRRRQEISARRSAGARKAAVTRRLKAQG